MYSGPPASIKVWYISLFATTAPIGIEPLVMPLAKFIMSGITPNASAPKAAPALPKPVMTSSKINKMLWSSQIFRKR